jgi:acyl-CoA thioester hydrolase
MNELLAGYPVVIQIPVAWGEMDAYGHVNNAVYFRYFESARIAYFRQLELKQFMDQSGVGPILASIQCRFKLPLTFPDTLSVGASVIELGEDRFTMHHRIVSHRHNRVAAEGDGVVVTYDYQLGKKAPLPVEVRAAIMRVQEMVA